jgi:hypothetical protein
MLNMEENHEKKTITLCSSLKVVNL